LALLPTNLSVAGRASPLHWRSRRLHPGAASGHRAVASASAPLRLFLRSLLRSPSLCLRVLVAFPSPARRPICLKSSFHEPRTESAPACASACAPPGATRARSHPATVASMPPSPAAALGAGIAADVLPERRRRERSLAEALVDALGVDVPVKLSLIARPPPRPRYCSVFLTRCSICLLAYLVLLGLDENPAPSLWRCHAGGRASRPTRDIAHVVVHRRFLPSTTRRGGPATPASPTASLHRSNRSGTSAQHCGAKPQGAGSNPYVEVLRARSYGVLRTHCRRREVRTPPGFSLAGRDPATARFLSDYGQPKMGEKTSWVPPWRYGAQCFVPEARKSSTSPTGSTRPTRCRRRRWSSRTRGPASSGVHLAVGRPRGVPEPPGRGAPHGRRGAPARGPRQLAAGLLAADRFGRGGVRRATSSARLGRLERCPRTCHGRRHLIFARSPPVGRREPLAEAGDPFRPRRPRASTCRTPRATATRSVPRSVGVPLSAATPTVCTHETGAGSGLRLGRPCELQVSDSASSTRLVRVTFRRVRPGRILLVLDAYLLCRRGQSRGNRRRSSASSPTPSCESRRREAERVSAGLGCTFSMLDSTNARAPSWRQPSAAHGTLSSPARGAILRCPGARVALLSPPASGS